MSDELNRKDGETEDQHTLRLYRVLEPMAQVIFMYALKVSAKDRAVSVEVAMTRARDLINRYRAGYSPTIGDLDAIGEP